MKKLFSCVSDHCDMVKCRQNVNFEEIDTVCLQQEKMMDIAYCVEYLWSISNNKILLWQY